MTTNISTGTVEQKLPYLNKRGRRRPPLDGATSTLRSERWQDAIMLEILGRFLSVDHDLREMQERLRGVAEQEAFLNDTDRQLVKQVFEQAHLLFDKHGLPHASRLALNHTQEPSPLSYRRAGERLTDLRRAFRDDCARDVFVIPPAKTAYVDSRLSNEIGWSFPKAAAEVQRAGACYSFGLNTASVFHFMRAAEHALKAFVASIGITEPIPALEFKMWGELIKDAKGVYERAPIKTWDDPAKEAARAFFTTMLMEFNAYKDDIRNVLMHARDQQTYTDAEVLTIRTRVVDTLTRLTKRGVQEDRPVALLEEATFSRP